MYVVRPDLLTFPTRRSSDLSTASKPGGLMPSRRRPDPEPTLSIFPDQVHIGDRFDDAETGDEPQEWEVASRDRKSTRMNSSNANNSYAVFCLKKTYHISIRS